jgi:hypothetical protein
MRGDHEEKSLGYGCQCFRREIGESKWSELQKAYLVDFRSATYISISTCCCRHKSVPLICSGPKIINVPQIQNSIPQPLGIGNEAGRESKTMAVEYFRWPETAHINACERDLSQDICSQNSQREMRTFNDCFPKRRTEIRINMVSPSTAGCKPYRSFCWAEARTFLASSSPWSR